MHLCASDGQDVNVQVSLSDDLYKTLGLLNDYAYAVAKQQSISRAIEKEQNGIEEVMPEKMLKKCRHLLKK